jgi:heat shock protein HslJ
VIVATYELCQNKINKLDETSIRMLRKPDEVKMDKVINLILSIEPEAFGIK